RWPATTANAGVRPRRLRRGDAMRVGWEFQDGLRSVAEVAPAPWWSWAPVELSPEPVLLPVVGLLKEKAELAFNRHSGYECVDRLVRIRLLQGVQQDGDGVHIVEGGVRGGTGSERISLLIGTHHPQGSQQ